MANIEQVIRVLTNRSGAVNDAYQDLAADSNLTYRNTAGNTVNFQIHTRHLDTGTSSGQVLTQGTDSDGTFITRGDLASADFMIGTDGAITTIDPDAINLSDVHVAAEGTAFTNAGIQGLSGAPDWHEGDLLIINNANSNTSDNGTYIFIGADDTATSAATTADFQMLVFQNTINIQDDSTATAGGTAQTLNFTGSGVTVTHAANSTTATINIDDTGISNITRNSYYNEIAIPTTGTGDLTVPLELSDFVSINSAPALTTFPNSSAFYVEGNKAFPRSTFTFNGASTTFGDFQYNSDRDEVSFFISAARRADAVANGITMLSVELETLT